MPVDLRYPTGKFTLPTHTGSEDRSARITAIRDLPARIRSLTQSLSDLNLASTYRSGGWSIRQIVHHLADSHINCHCRFRLALTEDEPGIRGYAEDKWAELHDAGSAPVALSLDILGGLHARWALLLDSMTEADFARGFVHPHLGRRSLDQTLALYAWHGRHHEAHIRIARGIEP